MGLGDLLSGAVKAAESVIPKGVVESAKKAVAGAAQKGMALVENAKNITVGDAASVIVPGSVSAGKNIIQKLLRGSAKKRRASKKRRCTASRMYNKIDKDHDGSITLEEVVAAFEKADKSGKGTLTYQEFKDSCRRKPYERKSASSKKRATPKKASPAKSPKKASPKKSPKKASPKKSPKKASPAKSPKKASPKKSPKKASPKKSPKKASPAKSPKKASPKKSPKKSPKTKTTKSGAKRPSARAMFDAGAPVGTKAIYSDGSVKCLTVAASGRPYLGKC